MHTRTISLITILTLTIYSCDGHNTGEGRCVGNLGPSGCGSQSLKFSGQYGIGCEQCTSNLHTEDFALGFKADLLPDGDITTVFNFFNQTFFIELTPDRQCERINLLVEGQDGLVLTGTLENITFDRPDNLSISIELIGEMLEEVFCEFCWFGAKPRCADIDDDGNGDCVPFEDIPNAVCLAESMINSCDSIFCGSAVGHVGIDGRFCEIVDCGTLACERIEFVHESFLTARPGTLNDIHVDDLGILSGIMNRDGEEDAFTCGVPVASP